MAIYHLRASMISRSQGRSATAAAAYRVAERIHDRRTGLDFDYAKKAGVEHVEILAPDHAPDWVRDRSELWNRVEEAETRKNSQVAREIRVALPAELSHAARVELVRGFAQAQFVDRGMIADIALHAPGREGDERNHHAHILLTTREIGSSGFEAKNRDWNGKDLLEGWREAWARDSNAALERYGVDERIDHRTLEAQREDALERAEVARVAGDEARHIEETARALELDRDPLPQLSRGAWQRKERGQDSPAVEAWHQVKAAMVATREVAQAFRERAADWVRDRLEAVRDRLPSAQEWDSFFARAEEGPVREGTAERAGRSDEGVPQRARQDRVRAPDAQGAADGSSQQRRVRRDGQDGPEPQEGSQRAAQRPSDKDMEAFFADAAREGVRDSLGRDLERERNQADREEKERQQKLEQELKLERELQDKLTLRNNVWSR